MGWACDGSFSLAGTKSRGNSWRTDPENVWVWGFIIGSVIGIAVALAVSAWWLSRTATRRKVQDNERQGV